MALIICAECGGKVSDRAQSCPHCGAPVKADSPTPPPISGEALKTPKTQQGSVGLETQSLKCPNCGEPLQSKDIVSSGWAHCPSCGYDVALNGINQQFVDEGIIEKIMPFGDSKEEFHRRCMESMMEVGPEDFFSTVRDIKVTKKYIWVREFGRGPQRQIYPMDKYGESFIRRVFKGSAVPNNEAYDKYWPVGDMEEFNNETARGADIIPKEISAKECKHRYSIDTDSLGYPEKDCYYCLPVYDETFSYKGQTYRFQGVGTRGIPHICWDYRPTDDECINNTPDYFTACPMLITAIVIAAIIALICVISIFAANGFWAGIIITIIVGALIGFIGSFVGPLIAIPLYGIDKIIQMSINTSRRRKFRQRYEEIQRNKQAEAKQHMNFDFDYTIPEFPLPKK